MTKFENSWGTQGEKVCLESSLSQGKEGDGVGVGPVTEQAVKR